MSKAVRDLAARERDDLADLLETLSPEQWASPSLCAGWSVRDAAAHLISYDVIGWPDTVRRMARGRRHPGGPNELGIDDLRHLGNDELVGVIRTHRCVRGLASGFGGRVALLDGMLHQQDIRRPLGLPRRIDPRALVTALRFAVYAPPIRGPQRSWGLRLEATDVPWSYGRGPAVRGPGEALLLAVAGRRVALTELDGAGLDRLAARC